MKRAELVRRIANRAQTVGVKWEFEAEGASHEKWRCGRVRVVIPRHREINERTAEGICRGLESELGEGWWRE